MSIIIIFFCLFGVQIISVLVPVPYGNDLQNPHRMRILAGSVTPPVVAVIASVVVTDMSYVKSPLEQSLESPTMQTCYDRTRVPPPLLFEVIYNQTRTNMHSVLTAIFPREPLIEGLRERTE